MVSLWIPFLFIGLLLFNIRFSGALIAQESGMRPLCRPLGATMSAGADVVSQRLDPLFEGALGQRCQRGVSAA